MSLSANVKCYRRARGLSQEYMGETLGMHQSAYSRLENREAGCEQRLTQIADALNTTPEVLRAYHLTVNPITLSNPVHSSVESVLAEKENLIQWQHQEIKFLHQHITYLQTMWHHVYGGQPNRQLEL